MSYDKRKKRHYGTPLGRIMKTTLTLAFTLCLTMPAFAQGGKLVKPVAKAAAVSNTVALTGGKEFSAALAKEAYITAAGNYKRLTPPLVSSDYALRTGQHLRAQLAPASGELQKKLFQLVNKKVVRLEQLKAEREQALLNYGKTLAENHGLLKAVSDMPSPLPDTYAHPAPGYGSNAPLLEYARAVTHTTPSAALEQMTLEQRAVLLFMRADLREAAEQLGETLGSPDPLGEGISVSFAAANKLVRLVNVMLRSPNAFQPQLFELNIAVAAAHDTPLARYLNEKLQSDPNYPLYYSWIHAKNTADRLPFHRMYEILSGGK